MTEPIQKAEAADMKRQLVVSVFIALMLASVVSMTLLAQNPNPLRTVNGIALSEFNGYDTWQTIAVSHPDKGGGCGSTKEDCIKVILGNAAMVNAYKEGFPGNGKPAPDGAAMAKVEWNQKHNTSPYGITVPTVETGVAFMLKDSKRFTQTNGWGYAMFLRDAATDNFKTSTDDPAVMRTLCHSCHTSGAKARDYVFTNYAKR